MEVLLLMVMSTLLPLGLLVVGWVAVWVVTERMRQGEREKWEQTIKTNGWGEAEDVH